VAVRCNVQIWRTYFVRNLDDFDEVTDANSEAHLVNNVRNRNAQKTTK
jgi:hypothetical protein